MKFGKFFQSLLLAGVIVILLDTPAKSEEVREDIRVANKNIPQLRKIEDYISKEQILGQIPTPDNSLSQEEKQADIIPITGVEVNPTDSGVEVILQTPLGEKLQISDRSNGNNFIAEIANAQLQLPSGKPFHSPNPVAGISEIVITNLDDKTIQVTVVGETALPQVELFDSDEGLILGLTPLNPLLPRGESNPPPLTREESERGQETQTPTPQPEAGQVIPVTGIQLNPTETGIELLLQTPPGLTEQLQPNNVSEENNFIADIPNAQLQLPNDRPFRVEKPVDGINEVTVNNLDASTIRVTAVGETALPQVELFDSNEGLIFGFTPPPPLPRGESSPPPFTRGEQEGGQVATIDRVQLNPTETGFEILLLTPTGTAQQLRVVNMSEGNNFIAEIPNAQLQQPFRAEKPIEGVSEVTVTNRDKNTVLVTVVGENKQPTVELFDSEEGLIFSATPPGGQTAQEEDIELVVTGEQDGYRVPDATSATRTDTPIRDIPRAIQVIPQQVLDDRNVQTLDESVETVSSVVDGGVSGESRVIRGFSQDGNLRNGSRDNNFNTLAPGVNTIERVEVLKGPASVLYGALEPGGIVNIVTKTPLSEPFYKLAFEAGNFGYYQPIVDFTGPLSSDKSVLYRFVASYQDSNSFQDFVSTNRTEIAPSMTLKLGDNTTLNLYYEYNRFFGDPPETYTGILSDGRKLSRSFYLGYPELDTIETTSHRFGYTLSHKFNDRWQLRNDFAVLMDYGSGESSSPEELVDDRFVIFKAQDSETSFNNYVGRIDLQGKFNTGAIAHQLLIGFDFNRTVSKFTQLATFDIPALDIFNPDYNISEPEYVPDTDSEQSTEAYGIYLQDQITLLDNLKFWSGAFLCGHATGRFG